MVAHIDITTGSCEETQSEEVRADNFGSGGTPPGPELWITRKESEEFSDHVLRKAHRRYSASYRTCDESFKAQVPIRQDGNDDIGQSTEQVI